MLEDLKVYLSSIIRPKHIASEMELSLYKVSLFYLLSNFSTEIPREKNIAINSFINAIH